jgi:hypothetical protein
MNNKNAETDQLFCEGIVKQINICGQYTFASIEF